MPDQIAGVERDLAMNGIPPLMLSPCVFVLLSVIPVDRGIALFRLFRFSSRFSVIQ